MFNLYARVQPDSDDEESAGRLLEASGKTTTHIKSLTKWWLGWLAALQVVCALAMAAGGTILHHISAHKHGSLTMRARILH